MNVLRLPVRLIRIIKLDVPGHIMKDAMNLIIRKPEMERGPSVRTVVSQLTQDIVVRDYKTAGGQTHGMTVVEIDAKVERRKADAGFLTVNVEEQGTICG